MTSKIEWTDTTWNPVTGCTKISPGCKNCYAERMSKRLQSMGNFKYMHGFEVAIHGHILNDPLRWVKPRRIFVNSMSDLFHEEIPYDFLKDIFKVMNKANHHVFQVLTKRPHIAFARTHSLKFSDNIWLGVSIESEDYQHRIDSLLLTEAKTKFLSLEPLLGPLTIIDLEGIDWVIVGGESGPGARPIKAEWVREIRDNCAENKVPFFFKQWGGTNKKRTGRLLDGLEYNQFPLKI